MKNKLHKIPIDVYNLDLLIFFGHMSECCKLLSKRLDQRYIDKLMEMGSDNKGLFFHVQDVYLIWLPDIPNTFRKYAILVHELEHATYRILTYKDLIHTAESDEGYAYLLEYLYYKSLVLINNLKKNRDEKEI